MHLRPSFIPPTLTIPKARSLPPNFTTDPRRFPEKISTLPLDANGPLESRNTAFLFNYEIFPSHILRHSAEWQAEQRPMHPGDIILQHAYMPPLGAGLCMDFAVRIAALIDDGNITGPGGTRIRRRLGFSYVTLTGHPECGLSEFYIEERAGDSSLHFTIRTWSRPGHWTARLAKHAFTLPYQAWCTRRALRQVRQRFQAGNPRS